MRLVSEKHIPRLYLADFNPNAGQFALDVDARHYLVNVLRLGVGDAVHLFGPQTGEWLAKLVTLDKKNAVLEIGVCTRAFLPTTPLRVLCFGLPKREQSAWLLEKATELGVTMLVPVLTSRVQAHNWSQEKAQKIIIEAAEQCERLDLPTLLEPISLAKLVDQFTPLYWAAERSVTQAPLSITDKNQPLNFLIGPPGGFSEAEQELLRQTPKAIPFTLGPRILRTETAALAALSIAN